MKLTDIERETIILFNERESTASIQTYNVRLQTRFAEYAKQNPDKVKAGTMDSNGALLCTLPKNDLRILFKKPRSDKQLSASKENARKMLEKRESALSSQG